MWRWVGNTLIDKICIVVFNSFLSWRRFIKPENVSGECSHFGLMVQVRIRIVTFVLCPFVVKQDSLKIVDLSLIFVYNPLNI